MKLGTMSFLSFPLVYPWVGYEHCISPIANVGIALRKPVSFKMQHLESDSHGYSINIYLIISVLTQNKSMFSYYLPIWSYLKRGPLCSDCPETLSLVVWNVGRFVLARGLFCPKHGSFCLVRCPFCPSTKDFYSWLAFFPLKFITSLARQVSPQKELKIAEWTHTFAGFLMI